MESLENFRLKVFRAVADALSFRGAAERLHMSQPAVSQQVHALEEELGTTLFDRSNNRIRLTREGEVLRRYAVRLARLCGEAQEALAQLHGEPAGELRLGASTTVAQYILPRLLGEFRRLHPAIALSLTSGNTEEMVEGLRRGRTAMAIIEGPVSSREVHKQRFLEDRMVLVVPRTHRWASLGEIEPAALAEETLLMREPGSGSRRVVELALRRAGLPLRQFRSTMPLDSTEAIISGVEAGLGIGFVSEWAIRKEVRLGTLRAMRVRGLEMARDLSLIRPAGPAPGGAAGAFERFALAQATRGSR